MQQRWRRERDSRSSWRALASLVAMMVMVAVIAPATPVFSAGHEMIKRGGTLRVAYGNKISHLDFHTAPGYEMMWVAMNIGCGLVNITPDKQLWVTQQNRGVSRTIA